MNNHKLHNQSMDIMQFQKFSWGKSLSLKSKATFLAIAIGVCPTILTGFIAYQIADNIVKKQVYDTQENDTKVMLKRVEYFLQERYQDLEIIAHASIFKDSNLKNNTTERQKSLEFTNL